MGKPGNILDEMTEKEKTTMWLKYYSWKDGANEQARVAQKAGILKLRGKNPAARKIARPHTEH
jgi:hypothetical protein